MTLFDTAKSTPCFRYLNDCLTAYVLVDIVFLAIVACRLLLFFAVAI